MSQLKTKWNKARRVWAFDIEARPGPWGGGDFTFRNMLSMAAGFEGDSICYIAPGFLKMELERLILPIRNNERILVVGHNAIRYDLPMLNGTLVKLGRPPLPPLLVSDTYAHLVKSDYAYSKSLGNLAQRFGVQPKGSMSEYGWERVYEGDPEWLQRLMIYNVGDVETTLALRHVLLERGILKPPRWWKP